MLMMQHPIGLGDCVNVQQPVGAAFFGETRAARQQPLTLNSAIDNHMSDVEVLRPEFAGQTLRQGPQRRFGARERCEVRLAIAAPRPRRAPTPTTRTDPLT